MFSMENLLVLLTSVASFDMKLPRNYHLIASSLIEYGKESQSTVLIVELFPCLL